MRSHALDLKVCCMHIRTQRERLIVHEAMIREAIRHGRAVSTDDILSAGEARSAVANHTHAARQIAQDVVDITAAGQRYPALFAMLSVFDQYWQRHVAERRASGTTAAFDAYMADLRAAARAAPLAEVAALFVILSRRHGQFWIVLAQHPEAHTLRQVDARRARRNHLALVHG